MRIIDVVSGENTYNVCVTRGFDGLAEALSQAGLAGRRTAVICDDGVAPLYLADVRERVAPNAEYYAEMIIGAGEAAKSFPALESICSFLMDNRMQRDSLMIILGGGVVSDVAGFAAAIYMRGIPYVIVSTTLLSMCDSSIGGKTGIDIGEHKNVVGAFAAPALVYSNVETLRTLPAREFASGMAEVVKHALIKDESYLEWIGSNLDGIRAKDLDTLDRLVTWSCEIKAGVVAQDEFERKGVREILNFGHTFGHAIEGLSGYNMRHGECVSIGTSAALRLSAHFGYIGDDEVRSAIGLLKTLGLPTGVTAGGFSPEQIYDLMLSDKKVKGGKLRLILLKQVGEAVIYAPTREEVLIGLQMTMTTNKGDEHGMGKQ
ncbi:MAG: 3-dehydroquinate synthase [Defluviitaleaceae bacterium]|nr:3-dehydroquinate synthase [Defluviitaleaceae bacterium]